MSQASYQESMPCSCLLLMEQKKNSFQRLSINTMSAKVSSKVLPLLYFPPSLLPIQSKNAYYEQDSIDFAVIACESHNSLISAFSCFCCICIGKHSHYHACAATSQTVAGLLLKPEKSFFGFQFLCKAQSTDRS